MNCHDALAAMLDAAPAELSGLGSGELGAHLRDCRRCARAAALLSSGGTQVLATMPHTAAPPRRAPRLVLAGAALAAIIWMVASRDAAPPTVERTPVPAPTVAAVTAPVAAESPVAVRAIAPRTVPPVPTPTVRRSIVPETVTPEPITPEPVRAVALLAEAAVVPEVMATTPRPSATFAVRPPDGRRAEVRQSADASIAIVLLH